MLEQIVSQLIEVFMLIVVIVGIGAICLAGYIIMILFIDYMKERR